MQKSFGGDVVVATSATRDGRFVLLRTYSDRNPGDYFLFQADGRVADRLMSRSDWLERERLAETRPIRYTARDGLPIEGFLTLPPGSDGKNLPLIVNPHGGPFGPFDTWGFETERQILAAHGYAVLQVNFRGSGNYGVAFVEKGHRQWGGTMQDDLTDATHWAIREGIADKNRICIYGASYGGYASLMGVAKEPDLYKCAVGYVGVYDMMMMYGRGDVPGTVRGKDFLMEVLGRTDLDPISPNKRAADIKVPVFLAAGGSDIRAPQAHSEAMERALKAAGKPVESLYYATEGHGFVKPEHQTEFFKRLLTFFNRHIGGRAPVVETKTAAK
jgi:dipeptidyl aminopeptidase/acylaminoacyl peptidase